ncbi:hypothetical protein N015_13200 [Pseudomonas asturiensis]|uniref:Uncharacterized protein n=1 Tax=Pseudomonas asturiensis TaxID=1190415 RepID=A0ABX6HCK8_9PSED|nr:hypothetical protein [Pseudomonas asturiensis]QHF03311.1 hypothetical protein N015_13200 [Pseudomonas asturiensis]
MNQDQLNCEMKLIFAKACAEALRDPLDNMLRMKLGKDELEAFSIAVGTLYSSTYTQLHNHLVIARSQASMEQGADKGLSSNSREAAPQSPSASLCQEECVRPECKEPCSVSDRSQSGR